jgi:hypothetical protein
MENYATTRTDNNQREELPSPSIMERDQPGGSSVQHRDVSSSGASTSYLSAQDLAEISTSSPRNLPIRRVSHPALQEAQARDQARDSSLNADAPVWDMARISSLKPMNGSSSSYHKDLPIEEVPESALRTAQHYDQAQDPVQVPFNSQSGEDLLRHFDELQTHPDWRISTKWLRQLSPSTHKRHVFHVEQLFKYHGREVDAARVKEWSDGLRQPKTTPEERRYFAEHRDVVAQICKDHDETVKAALQQKPKTKAVQDHLYLAATLNDHLSATKAANAEAQIHLMELFSSMSSGLSRN